MKKICLAFAILASISACSSSGTAGSPLVQDKVLQLTAKTAVSFSTLATAGVVLGAAHFIYDPLAPNWEIEELRINNDTYRFALKMKRYHTGGAGEPIQVVKRRASQLQIDQGFSSYQLIEYTEGIESETLGARRVAEGTIKLVQRQQADSFMLNERN